MNYFYKILLLVYVCLVPLPLFSQEKASNRLLQDIVEQLPESIMSSNIIVIDRDKKGIIEHVGIKLFNREIMAKHSSPLYHFVERYLLELLLQPNNEQIKTKLKMDRVVISSGMIQLSDYKKGIKQIAESFSSDCSIHITSNTKRYSLLCITGNNVLLKMSFPVRHELITGLNKLEAESSMYMSLLSHRMEKTPSLTMDEVSNYQDSLYSYNDDFFAMENFISTSYYKEEKGRLKPLFSKRYMPESIYNLFNALHDWGVNVEITQNMYGGKKQTYTLPLYRLLHFLQKQNCLVYSGIKKIEGSMIEGTVLAVNMELGYQHLLSYKVSKNVFDRPKDTLINLKIYSYIPIHNVASLFFDDNKKE